MVGFSLQILSPFRLNETQCVGRIEKTCIVTAVNHMYDGFQLHSIFFSDCTNIFDFS